MHPLLLLAVLACADKGGDDSGGTLDGGATDGGGAADGGGGGTDGGTGDGGTSGDGGTVDGGTGDGGTSGDGGTGDGGTGDGGTGDGGTGDGGTGDGGTGDGGATPAAVVEGLAATIHDQMGSIVVLSWSQTGTGTFRGELAVDGGEWFATPSYTLGDGAHELLLLGAPFDATVSWRLVQGDEPVADDAEIETDPAPAGIPSVRATSGDPALWDSDVRYILASLAPRSGSRAWTVIIDRQGRPVWAAETPSRRTTFAPQLSVDETEVLVDHNSWWGAFDGGVNSQVARLDIEGNTLGTYDTPGLIHPFTQTGSGAIVYGASQGTSGSAGETLDIVDAEGEEPRTLLECNDFVAEHGERYCGSNALWWNPEGDHILFSLYSVETVIEVDPDGEPVRWFGHMDGAWSFADPDTMFYWQHGVHFLEDGHLLVSTRIDDRTEETVLREYTLDEATETLTQVWTFGEGEGRWAYIMGEGRRLPGGNTLQNLGYSPEMVEVTPGGELAWSMEWSTSAGTLGRTFPVYDLYALWHGAP